MSTPAASTEELCGRRPRDFLVWDREWGQGVIMTTTDCDPDRRTPLAAGEFVAG